MLIVSQVRKSDLKILESLKALVVEQSTNHNAFLPTVNQEWQTENLLLQWFSICAAFWQHTKLEKLFALGGAEG